MRCDSDFNPDLIFALGDTVIDNGHSPDWRLSGGDWHGTAAMEGTTQIHTWTAKWPVGSMVSAALAANEAFKYVMRRLPLRGQADQFFFEASPYCSWNFDSVPIPEEGVNLGEVDMVSAGAISQAALYALMRLPKVQMTGRIFDDDLTVPSNLNRNMLTLVTDVASTKVLVVAERCGTKLLLQPIPKRFMIEAPEAERLAPRVLVGVDDIPSRWQVQRCASGCLVVSGTSHFSVSSSCHSPGEPCCGCLHPVDDPRRGKRNPDHLIRLFLGRVGNGSSAYPGNAPHSIFSRSTASLADATQDGSTPCRNVVASRAPPRLPGQVLCCPGYRKFVAVARQMQSCSRTTLCVSGLGISNPVLGAGPARYGRWQV